MKRRKRRTSLDKVILGAAKQVRKSKLEFEREASRILSEALGFLVVVKIKKPNPSDSQSREMRRAVRLDPQKVSELINGQLETMADFEF
jgi:hypothetical protein